MIPSARKIPKDTKIDSKDRDVHLLKHQNTVQIEAPRQNQNLRDDMLKMEVLVLSMIFHIN